LAWSGIRTFDIEWVSYGAVPATLTLKLLLAPTVRRYTDCGPNTDWPPLQREVKFESDAHVFPVMFETVAVVIGPPGAAQVGSTAKAAEHINARGKANTRFFIIITP